MDIKQVLQSKKSTVIKISLGIILVILAVMFAVSHIVGENVEAFVQTELVKYVEKRVDGRVVLNNVELTLTGSVAVNGLEIYDKNEKPLLKSSFVKISYKWFDFGSSQYNMTRIEKILIQDCEVFIREKENKELNIEAILKTDKESDATKTDLWNGHIELENCKISLETSSPIKKVEEIKAKFDFKDKIIDIALAGKVEGIAINTKGVFDKDSNTLSIEIKDNIKIEENNVNNLGLNSESFKLQQLVVDKIVVSLNKGSEDKYNIKSNGSFLSLNTSGDIEIKDGRGDFVYNDDVLELSNLTFNISNQSASGGGKVFLPKDQEKDVKVDFDISLPQIEPSSLVKNLQTQGLLAVIVKISGSMEQLQINGNFNLPEINFEGFVINNLSGIFGVDTNNKKVNLQQVRGNNGAGMIYAAGDIFIDNEVYELDISGEGLDPASIVDPKIKLKGSLGFNGHMSSRADGAIIKGNFAVYNGSIYDISFQSLSGFFVKQGGKTSFSDLVIKTKFGVIYPEELAADKLNLASLKGDNSGLNKLNPDNVKEDVKQQVKDKIISGIKR